MNWILEHFQIIALIALGVGSVLKSTLEKKGKQQSEQEDNGSEEVFAPDEVVNKPPLPDHVGQDVQQRVPPPLRELGYDAAVADEAAKALKHQQDLANKLQKLRDNKATTTGGAAVTRARVMSKGSKMPHSMPALTIRARLRSRQEIRAALVMSEVLAPPVGLR